MWYERLPIRMTLFRVISVILLSLNLEDCRYCYVQAYLITEPFMYGFMVQVWLCVGKGVGRGVACVGA